MIDIDNQTVMQTDEQTVEQVSIDALLRDQDYDTPYLLKPTHFRDYVTGGKAYITVDNGNTRNTYRIERVRSFLYCVYILDAGWTYIGVYNSYSDNFNNVYYQYLPERLWPHSHSKIATLLHNMDNYDILAKYKIYHGKYCSRCGKLLTTPESIKRGIGPHCKRVKGEQQ